MEAFIPAQAGWFLVSIVYDPSSRMAFDDQMVPIVAWGMQGQAGEFSAVAIAPGQFDIDGPPKENEFWFVVGPDGMHYHRGKTYSDETTAREFVKEERANAR